MLRGHRAAGASRRKAGSGPLARSCDGQLPHVRKNRLRPADAGRSTRRHAVERGTNTSARLYFARELRPTAGEFISRSMSFCQANSGCFARCSAALKLRPQAWPSSSSQRHLLRDRGVGHLILHGPGGRVRRLPGAHAARRRLDVAAERALVGVRACPRTCRSGRPGISARRRQSILPLFCSINASQRSCRAFSLLLRSFGSKSVSSLISFGIVGEVGADEEAILRALQRHVLEPEFQARHFVRSCGRQSASYWHSRRCCLPS